MGLLDSLAVQLNYNVTDGGARRVLIRGNKNKIETLEHLQIGTVCNDWESFFSLRKMI